MKNALSSLGHEAQILSDPKKLSSFDLAIFPGVGSFTNVKDNADKNGFTESILKFVKSGKSLLGICLGMQILFEKGYEGLEENLKNSENNSTDSTDSRTEEFTQGFGLLKGKVTILPREKVGRVPHIGWNLLKIQDTNMSSSLFTKSLDIQKLYVYFVHSFYCEPEEKKDVIAHATLGDNFSVPAIVQRDNVAGMQFHPERSGEIGLKLLDNFVTNFNN